MRRYPLFWVTGFTLLLAAVATPAADTTPASADRSPVIRDEPLRQYRAYRRLHARSERFDQEGWLEAWTELDEHGFRFEIVSERGSEKVRNSVLKAVLKREQELVAAGDDARSALTTANYHFGEAVEENGLRYVALKPKRKDTLLVDGYMVMSSDGEDLLRVEGRLARNPSFWTSLVNIIRHYTRLDGVRVPIATESVAKVKLVGIARMDVRYEYESINNRPVSHAAREVMALAAWRCPSEQIAALALPLLRVRAEEPMSPTERRDTRLPVTEEVGSEGGSYADATNQVMTFSGPANPNASPADAIGGRMPFESEARGQFSGTSIGIEDDTASEMIRYPTEPPSPANARAGRRTASYPWRSALIGAAAGAVAVIGLSRLRQRWCC